MKRGFLKFITLLAFVAIAGVVVMLLWNTIIPSVIGWGAVSYPQAVGLFILCRVLFGGFSGIKARARYHMMGDKREELRERLKEMSPEQRHEYIRNYRSNGLKDE